MEFPRHPICDQLQQRALREETLEDGKRFYYSPSGMKLASITTILSALPKPELDAWRERVGDVKADQTSLYARERGNILHRLLEQYLCGSEPYFSSFDIFEKLLYKQVQKELDHNLTMIYAQETQLYSEELATAGRADLIGDWINTPSVIDFKGTTRDKKADWIKSYFLQCTAYSLMFEQETNIVVPQIVVVIANESADHPQVFIRQRDEFVPELKSIIDAYQGVSRHEEIAH